MNNPSKKIRVLIVDDSLTARNLLKIILREDPQFEIAGIVSSGEEAVAFCRSNKPDVISMDIHMPGMNGFQTTRKIMSENPVPIVIVSSAYNSTETQRSFQALEAGALAILPRPVGPGNPSFQQQTEKLKKTFRLVSEVKVVRRRDCGTTPDISKKTGPEGQSIRLNTDKMVLAIGASAGGPSAIRSFLNSLSPAFSLPILIVQHIDKGFADGYAEWLQGQTGMKVCSVSQNTLIEPGNIYLPPSDHHLGLSKRGMLTSRQSSPEEGLRPSINHLFRDVRIHYGSNSIAILFSGMGKDGTFELKQLKDCGALTLVQDEKTALVNGIPGEAIRLGAATRVLSPEKMSEAIIQYIDLNNTQHE